MTGTKPGCEQGQCGSCLILVDGKPTKSCLIKLRSLSGKNVTTIEGLSVEGALHPLQRAFAQVGAIQCGYCIPGIILRSKSFLDTNPFPTREEAAKILSGHLCRCGGYVKIIDAILLAARWQREGRVTEDYSTDGSLIGATIPKVDSWDKAKGSELFAGDVYLPGMLVAKLFRSPFHHAKLVSIDLSAAWKVSGIAGIYTAKDIPGVNRIKRIIDDQPVLVEDLIRSMGDPIALVVGETETAVNQAINEIKIECLPLPEILDSDSALRSSAAIVHPENSEGNVLKRQRMARGNIEEGFALSDIIIENTYTTPFNEHAYLETEAGVAYIDENGRVIIMACSQAPHYQREQIAAVLGIPREQIRVIQTTTGGAFGGKIHLSVHAVLALAAYHLRKPVKMVFSREESFIATPKRHPFKISIKTGANRDGKFTAFKAEIIADTGAYALTGPHVLNQAVLFSTGPYAWDHIEVEGTLVYTNNTLACGMRGFGVPQVAFAVESQIDSLARALGLDPLDIRLKNAINEDYVAPWGQPMTGQVGIKHSLEALQPYWKEFKEITAAKQQEDKINVGIGLAAGWNSNGRLAAANISVVRLELLPSGKIAVFSGATDLGQGSKTVLAQLLGEALSIPLSNITVILGDTDLTEDSDITCASKTSLTAGNALISAAKDLQLKASDIAASILKINPLELEYDCGVFRHRFDKSCYINIWDLALKAGKVVGLGTYVTDGTYYSAETCSGIPYRVYASVGMASMVEVDRNSGEVKVLKVIAITNVGTILNKIGAESQVEGSIAMGMGFALTEEYITGKTKGFKEYEITKAEDMPEILTRFVELPNIEGPHGAIGMGEVAIVPVAPSITNAIYDACGVRVKGLPIRKISFEKAE